MRAVDNVGNVGAFSESVAFATLALATVKEDRADSLSGAKATGTWALQDAGHGNTAYSDSPSGSYKAYEKSSLTLAPVEIVGPYGLLSLRQKVALEDGYDFGYVEISTDAGATWTQVARVTGETGAWEAKSYDISPQLAAGPNRVTLRLRLESDFSEQSDGWLVDDVVWSAAAR